MDAQSRAYRQAGIDDIVSDAQLSLMIDNGELVLSDAPPMPPEYHEATQWDAGREGPKTLETAKLALAQRVADPRAPDTDASAYDDLG